MRLVLDEVAGSLLGEPTGPLGPATSSSTDAATCHHAPASVLVYCHGEPFSAPLVGGGFAMCRCGDLIRVVW